MIVKLFHYFVYAKIYPKLKNKMSEKITKFLKSIYPAVLLCVLLFAFINIACAEDSLGDWSKYLEIDLPIFIGPEGASGEDMAANVIRRAIVFVKYMVGGGALLMGIIYGINFVLARGKEEVISKYKVNFLWLFVGFVIIMMSETVAKIFNPEKATSEALIDFKAADDQLRNVTNYIKWLFGSVIILLMTISGIKLILAQGQQEKITKEKNNLLYSSIGMLVLLLATNIVKAIYVINEETREVAAGEVKSGIAEIGGVIKLLLAFLGPVAIIFTIAA